MPGPHDSTEKKIEELLQKGLSKKEIKNQLKDKVDSGKLEFYLNNISSPKERARYQYLNLALVIILSFVTIKKLFFALSIGSFSLTMLLALVVPTINLYILREIMRFRRLGYQFLCILSTLSLLNAENRAMPEIILIPAMIVLSGFLYWRLFPLKRAKN